VTACPPAIIERYAQYDRAFSNRDVPALEQIETPNFLDTDPDGTRRGLKAASENQARFFAMVKTMKLTSAVQCQKLSDTSYQAIATVTLNALFSPPHGHASHLHQVYVNHDRWTNIDGKWRLASQTTVKLDGSYDGQTIHLTLPATHPPTSLSRSAKVTA
jgi:hypothetical protein